MKKNDQAVSQRAYEIWQSEGQPEGRHDAHWHQASEELGGKSAKAKPAAGKTAKTKSKPAASKSAAPKPTAVKSSPKAAEKGAAKKDDVAAARSKIKLA